jgi:hypothetical protein
MAVYLSVNEFPLVMQGKYIYFFNDIKLLYNGNSKQVL